MAMIVFGLLAMRYKYVKTEQTSLEKDENFNADSNLTPSES